jgi:hypothetical protein
VIVWALIGFAVYAYLKKKSPDKLAALGATMATDEIDFAEARVPSLSADGLPYEHQESEKQ